MTPEARHALIFRPFHITTFGCSNRWGGCTVGDSFPVGREGEDLLHDREVNPFPMQCDYVINREQGKRFLPEFHTWPTKTHSEQQEQVFE